jgi:hypothetical protein
MLIDLVFPQVVADRTTLRQRLVDEAMSKGIDNVVANELVALLPQKLRDAECFLDKITGLWRYEFGLPHKIGGDLMWGTHMWVPVGCLVLALSCVKRRLAADKRADYLARLADPERHQVTLVEMIPATKIDLAIRADFEVAGLGVGNRSVDWNIEPCAGRTVLLDVKRRTRDFIEQAELSTDEMTQAPEPRHDPGILFRSVEQKFVPADPDGRLQGVWIVTDIQQDEEKLANAFKALDSTKVHFAILGDWEPDACILSMRPGDEQLLRGLFHLQPSSRYTFKRNEG